MPKTFHPTWQPLPTTTARVHTVSAYGRRDRGRWLWRRAGALEVAGLFLMGQGPVQHRTALLQPAVDGVLRGAAVASGDRSLGHHRPGDRPAGLQAARRRQRPPEGVRVDRGAARDRCRVEACKQIVADGFKALKLRFHSQDWRDDIKTLEAVRKAVGDKIDIMVDGNWGWRISPDLQKHRWDLRTAIAAAKAMEEYGVY